MLSNPRRGYRIRSDPIPRSSQKGHRHDLFLSRRPSGCVAVRLLLYITVPAANAFVRFLLSQKSGTANPTDICVGQQREYHSITQRVRGTAQTHAGLSTLALFPPRLIPRHIISTYPHSLCCWVDVWISQGHLRGGASFRSWQG